MTGQRFDAVKAVGRLRKFGVEECASCSARKINRVQEDGLGKKKKKEFGEFGTVHPAYSSLVCVPL